MTDCSSLSSSLSRDAELERLRAGAPMAAPAFSLAARAVAALGDQIKAAVAVVKRPDAAAEHPFVLTRENAAHARSVLGGSVVELNDGSFAVIPLKNFLSVPTEPAAALKLFASTDGAVCPAAGGRHELDPATVKAVALGVLSDKADPAKRGANADKLVPAVGDPPLACELDNIHSAVAASLYNVGSCRRGSGRE